MNIFFARAGRDRLWEELAHVGQHREHFDLIQKPLRGFNVHELPNPVRHFIE